jgi:hypothetical protein
MHDAKLQQDFDRILENSQRRLKQHLSRQWGPNDWAVVNRGNQRRGQSVIRMETAPDEILTRPGLQPKAVYLTGS